MDTRNAGFVKIGDRTLELRDAALGGKFGDVSHDTITLKLRRDAFPLLPCGTWLWIETQKGRARYLVQSIEDAADGVTYKFISIPPSESSASFDPTITLVIPC